MNWSRLLLIVLLVPIVCVGGALQYPQQINLTDVELFQRHNAPFLLKGSTRVYRNIDANARSGSAPLSHTVRHTNLYYFRCAPK